MDQLMSELTNLAYGDAGTVSAVHMYSRPMEMNCCKTNWDRTAKVITSFGGHHDTVLIEVAFYKGIRILQLDWNNEGLHYSWKDKGRDVIRPHDALKCATVDDLQTNIRKHGSSTIPPKLSEDLDPNNDVRKFEFLMKHLEYLGNGHYDLFDFNCQGFCKYLMKAYKEPWKQSGSLITGCCMGRSDKMPDMFKNVQSMRTKIATAVVVAGAAGAVLGSKASAGNNLV